MKTRWLLTVGGVAVCGQALALLAACATDADTNPTLAEETPTPLPATDGGADARDDGDAAPCVDDCEYYPTECSEDALCFSGLFDPVASPGSLDLRTKVTALGGRSANDVWLAGTVGGVGHFDGVAWKRSVVDTQQSFYGLWLLGNAEVAFDDPRRLYTRGIDARPGAADASAGPDASADGWSFYGTATVPPSWGSGDARVDATYAHPGAPSLWIGVSTTMSGAGGLWRMRHSEEDGTFVVTAVTENLSAGLPCNEVYGLHGSSPNEIWAVGPRGAAFRVANAESDTPTLMGFNTLTTYALDGVWAAASNDVWAVGSSGTVRRYRGDARFWEIYEEIPTKQHLRAIAGSSSNDIWIAGDEGTVFHYDGAAWKRVKVAGLGARRPRLDQIFVPSPGKVWIAGQGVLVSLGGKS